MALRNRELHAINDDDDDSIATMVVSLAVSAQYTNVTDSQPDIQTLHDGKKLTRVCSIFAMVSSTSSLACSTLDCGTEPC